MTDFAVELKALSVNLGGQTVLDRVDLSVNPGEYLAILGPNGGGKSTLLKVILGLHRPSSGEAQVLGQSPRQARRKVGYVPQQSAFDLDFPIRVSEVVRMGRLDSFRVGGFNQDDRLAVDEALDRVELRDLSLAPVGALSGGEVQRVLIARALARRPQLLLLDEPTSSLDERIGHSIWDLFDELSQEMTVMIVSHDMGAVARSVGSVACLNQQLHMHPSKELTSEILEAAYGCPIDLLAHGHPHRVLADHEGT
ncbi:MAG: metal ABC transporter ATP-binding protein [Myxococcota bacterium]|nr:metal ABC transporter ATP-binding protein [Myxococcota bacterium]